MVVFELHEISVPNASHSIVDIVDIIDTIDIIDIIEILINKIVLIK